MTILAADEIPCRDKRLFSLTHARRRFTMRNGHLSVHCSESFQHVYKKASGPLPVPALLLAALVVPFSVFGQDNSGWIGQRVITHFGAVLQIGNQVVDDEKRSTNLPVSGKDRRVFRVYRVEHVNGHWLWLKAEKEGIEGWVKAEFVIPYDQAIDYFTNQIRSNPTGGVW